HHAGTRIGVFIERGNPLLPRFIVRRRPHGSETPGLMPTAFDSMLCDERLDIAHRRCCISHSSRQARFTLRIALNAGGQSLLLDIDPATDLSAVTSTGTLPQRPRFDHTHSDSSLS